MSYLLTDHLGSTVAVTNSGGTLTSQQRYLPFGAERTIPNSPILGTDFGYTGQRMLDSGMGGIMDYKARFYSSALGRFIQPDSIIPSPANPQSWNRFSYVGNNPIMFVDPTGHISCSSVVEEDCSFENMSAEEVVKRNIRSKYDITVSDEGGKSWSLQNLRIAFLSLQNINNALNGKLKSIIGGATFMMAEYHPAADCLTCTYGGWTAGKNVTFYIMGNAAIRQMNIYHEFGHLIDSLPGPMYDVFTNALEGQNSPGYVGGNGYLNPSSLIEGQFVTSDLNYAFVEALQASKNTPAEQWADIFANYVAGNINMAEGAGKDMYRFVMNALAPYTRLPIPLTPPVIPSTAN